MNVFFEFFFEFGTYILIALQTLFGGIIGGIVKLFNIPAYVKIVAGYGKEFSIVDWILAVIAIILFIAIFALLIYIIFLLIRKYLRFRKTLVGQEDLLEELADLNKQVVRLTNEKDKIFAMRISQLGMNPEEVASYMQNELSDGSAPATAGGTSAAASSDTKDAPTKVEKAQGSRFYKLTEVDRAYENYIAPVYDENINLREICERYRNFACSRMNLYYEVNTIRLFIAGMASTKLLILQGISGTGKTSLPYSFGKFLANDATIASVQPSWRDKTELFGYFNEFTKHYNETDVLKAMYEAAYTNNLNLIVLDEMNIARVEYYFAEMLSILEMPNPDEWRLDIVPSVWDNDPKRLVAGKLQIPRNMWYIGTANNDDSTFAISDKVYDRAFPINLDSKGVPFDAPDTDPLELGYDHLDQLFAEAKQKYPMSRENSEKIAKLDIYVIEKLRLAFGNRILKQMQDFIPVYVACGGTEIDGIDYVMANKIFRKFESLNLAFIKDELKGLVAYMDKSFGKQNMKESKAYIERLQKLY